MFRRPRIDPAFQAVLQHVQRAKEALLSAVPSPRGRVHVPLAEAVLRFEESVAEARRAIARWESEHRGACEAGLVQALAAAERLRLDAPPLDFEAMVYALDDLIAPLDVFAAVERALRRRA